MVAPRVGISRWGSSFPSIIAYVACRPLLAVPEATSRVFTLLGDSNVCRNINKTNCGASPQLKNAQILS